MSHWTKKVEEQIISMIESGDSTMQNIADTCCVSLQKVIAVKSKYKIMYEEIK